VYAFDKGRRKRDLFPEKIIQTASVFNAVVKRL
jgi:hypothetical protein